MAIRGLEPNLKDKIELDQGKLEIMIFTRNNLFVSGTVCGQTFSEFNIDREFGSGQWVPGWISRVCPKQAPKLPKRAVEVILSAVDRWSQQNGSYFLDLAGRQQIENDLEAFMKFVEYLEEELEQAVEDNLDMFIREYGDWANMLGNRRTVEHIQQVIETAKLLHKQLGNLLTPDLRQLGQAVVNHFPSRPRLTDGPRPKGKR